MLKTWCHCLKNTPEFFGLWSIDLRIFYGDIIMTVEMSRLQERKQKNKNDPRNVEMWIRVPGFFSFRGSPGVKRTWWDPLCTLSTL